MGERNAGELRYTAFLSYSHKDSAAAGRLHRKLEAYRMPRRLAGTETARGPVPERLAPIFRDREELPAATDLSETVREALAGSGALIILCSPHSAGSLWVAEEIETFRRLHPGRPILAAILDGDPPDCFPKALRAFGEDGTWHEPLATDLRPGKDGAHLGLLKLVAGITGVGLDALVQRDAARRVRRVTAVTGAAVVAMLIMAALALVALDARREAERQRAEAEGLIEFMLTDLRTGLDSVGRLDLMNNVNRRAMRYYQNQGSPANLSDDGLELLAHAFEAVGQVEELGGNLDRAGSRYQAAYRTTATLLARNPDNPEWILAHARSENRLALTAITRNQLQEASERLGATRQMLASIFGWGRNQSEWHRLAGFAEGNSCVTRRRRGEDISLALDHCSRAVFHAQRLKALHPEDSNASYDLIFHLYWLAEAQRAAGRTGPARATDELYLELMSNQIANDPDNALWREQQMQVYVRRAEFLLEQGESRAAARFLEQARAISHRLAARDRQNAVWSDFEKQLSERSERSN